VLKHSGIKTAKATINNESVVSCWVLRFRLTIINDAMLQKNWTITKSIYFTKVLKHAKRKLYIMSQLLEIVPPIKINSKHFLPYFQFIQGFG